MNNVINSEHMSGIFSGIVVWFQIDVNRRKVKKYDYLYSHSPGSIYIYISEPGDDGELSIPRLFKVQLIAFNLPSTAP